MNKFVVTPALLLLGLTQSAIAAEKYVPWPSKDQLRQIQIDAFSCSRENSDSTCQSTRLEVSPANTYKRRDQIDQPARRLTAICAEPIKKDPKKQRGPQPSSGLGFGA